MSWRGVPWCFAAIACDIHPDDSGSADSATGADSAADTSDSTDPGGSGDTSAPVDSAGEPTDDTGDTVPTCTSGLVGARTIKVCGAVADQWAGTYLSGGAQGDQTTLAVGTYSYGEGEQVDVYLLQDFTSSGWLSSTMKVSGVSDAITNGFGMNPTLTGELDGDGVTDLTVSAMYADSGNVLVYLGPITDDLDPGDYDAVLGGDTWDGFGWGVSVVQDMEGDGDDELLVESYSYPWVSLSLFAGPVETSDASSAFATYATDGALSGAELSNGDLDGDGISELLVHVYPMGPDGYTMGSAPVLYLVSADAAGEVALEDYPMISTERGWGPEPHESNTADMDGDGYQDLLLEMRCEDSKKCAGEAQSAWFPGPITDSLGVTDASSTYTYDDGTGIGIGQIVVSTPVGDLDGDGQGGDILFILPGEDLVWFQPAPPTPGDTVLDAADVLLDSDLDVEGLYQTMALPDVDADGYDDLALGAGGADNGAEDAGAVYILFGGSW